MAINDLPILSALRTRMQWHQERQRVLAENISNSDTPNFKPRDLIEHVVEEADPGGERGFPGSVQVELDADLGFERIADYVSLAHRERPRGAVADTLCRS